MGLALPRTAQALQALREHIAMAIGLGTLALLCLSWSPIPRTAVH